MTYFMTRRKSLSQRVIFDSFRRRRRFKIEKGFSTNPAIDKKVLLQRIESLRLKKDIVLP